MGLAISPQVVSITGTANQVIASAPNGAVTLSLPQSINTGASPTFVGFISSATNVPAAIFSGGTDVGTASVNAGQIVLGSAPAVCGKITYDWQGGVLYLDNTWDNSGSNIRFRLRTAGTPVVALDITATRITFGSPNGVVSGGLDVRNITTNLATATFAGGSDVNSSATCGQIFIGSNASFLGKITYNSSPASLTIENTYNDVAGDIIFKTRTAGTPVEVVRMRGSGNVGVGVASPLSVLHLKAGTATANTAPFQVDAGTIETVARAGVCEYDGVQFYKVIDTTSGRGAVAVEPYVHLTAAGSAISTIANFFGATTNVAIVASAYYIIDVYCWFLNTTAGTVTWTFTNSAAPTSQDVVFEMSPLTGIVAPPGTASMLQGQIYNDATAALAITTGTLTDAVNHYMHTRIYLQNGTGTSLKIQATKNVGGTITPGINSYWIARRMSPNNIGSFVA